MLRNMKNQNANIIMQNKIFSQIAIGTLFLLIIPLLLMIFKIPLHDPGSGFETINWSLSDFIIIGFLIFSLSNIFVLIARKIQKKSQRIILAIILLLAFLWLWAELAVGIFTNRGS